MSIPSNLDPRIERTRRVVLEAAVEVIAESGMGRASIEAISDRSGVARSTIYRHWPDRMDLLMESIGAKLQDVAEVDTGNLKADLMLAFGQLCAMLENDDTRRMVVSHISEASRDPEMAKLHARFTARRRQTAVKIIGHAIDRGDLSKNVDPEQMADDIAAGMFFRAMIRQEPIDTVWLEGHLDRWISIHGG